MDFVYNNVNKAISIESSRQENTSIYNGIKKKIIDGLKKNAVFDKLFSYEKIAGSYADKLKISAPNEYDLILRFEFPAQKYVIIKPDEKNKGNVLIDLTKVLEHLENDNKNKEMYPLLKTWVDNGLLLGNKFQSWFESCIAQVLNENQHTYIKNHQTYKLQYKKSGPAHTIFVKKVTENDTLFSIDFVPGFLFRKDKSTSSRQLTSEYWEAIPRPLKGATCEPYTTFRTSYSDSERVLLEGKDHLKNALRLMKKFRDMRPKLHHLKSYYIKTIFMWLDEESKTKPLWQKPMFKVVRAAFKRLESALKAREIKYFWHPELNMLENLKVTQIEQMKIEVTKARKILHEPMQQSDIIDLFLSDSEQSRLSEEEFDVMSDSLEEEFELRPTD